jgi:NADH dehydrogenase [ubiquinone] 1 alpha subcomplex assembly factor 7
MMTIRQFGMATKPYRRLVTTRLLVPNNHRLKSSSTTTPTAVDDDNSSGVATTTTTSTTKAATDVPAAPKKQLLMVDSQPPSWPAAEPTWRRSDIFSAPLTFDTSLSLTGVPLDWRGYEPSTPLTHEIMAQIQMAGRPMSTADYMRLALTHPEHGYYINKKRHNSRNHVKQEDTATTTTTNDDDDFFNDDFLDTEPNNQLIGPAGDFVTAPEVSQVFGECLGVWFYIQWQQQQQQQQQQYEWQWLECGPGRGSLLVDVLQFAYQLVEASSSSSLSQQQGTPPSFLQACRAIHLVEASPMLRATQRHALDEWQQQRQAAATSSSSATSLLVTFKFHDTNTTNNGSKTRIVNSTEQEMRRLLDENDRTTLEIPVHWHDSLQSFMQWQEKNQAANGWIPIFGVCQEFLDALPVYSFEKTNEGYWRERLVDVAMREDAMIEDENDGIGGRTSIEPTRKNGWPADLNKPRLRIVLAPEATPALRTLLQTDERGFAISSASLSDAAPGSIVEVSPEGILVVLDLARMIQSQGGAALIIDYGQEGSADSIRGYSRHTQVHFLSRPGLADVTADVDFAALRHAMNHPKIMETTPRTIKHHISNNNKMDKDDSSSSSSTAEPTTSIPTSASAAIARAFGPVTQGEFLIAMGMQERVIQLMEREDVTDQQAEDLYNAMVRLASPDEMGGRYKVLCIVPQQTNMDTPPPGF